MDNWLERLVCRKQITERDGYIMTASQTAANLADAKTRITNLERERDSVVQAATQSKKELLEKVRALEGEKTALQDKYAELVAQQNQPIDQKFSQNFHLLSTATQEKLIAYEGKYRKVLVEYPARFVGKNPADTITMDVKGFCDAGISDHGLQAWLSDHNCRVKDAARDYPAKTFEQCCELSATRIMGRLPVPYGFDSDRWGRSEFWEFSTEVFYGAQQRGLSFDCLSASTEIMGENGYVLLRDVKPGEYVLSYDFEAKKVQKRKVLNVWKKGKLKTKKLYFMGIEKPVIATADHEFYFRTKTGETPKYEKFRLLEHGVHAHNYKNKVPYLKKHEFPPEDLEWLDEDLCFLIGHYIAEGWAQTDGGYWLCGDELERIYPILEAHQIRYSVKENGHGVPQAYIFKEAKINEVFSDCGKRAHLKQIPNYLKKLPDRKLEKIIWGYYWGDGGKTERDRVIFSTVSERLKDDLVEVHDRLGRPATVGYVEHSHGFKDSPIWRVQVHSRSLRLRNYGFPRLSETGLYEIEEGDEEEVIDIEVEKNHNFFIKNGILVGNCDSWQNLKYDLLGAAGIPCEMRRSAAGTTFTDEGHATGFMYFPTLGYFVHMNSTTQYRDNGDIYQFARAGDGTKDKLNLKTIWWTTNQKYSWQEVTTEAHAKELTRRRHWHAPQNKLLRKARITPIEEGMA